MNDWKLRRDNRKDAFLARTHAKLTVISEQLQALEAQECPEDRLNDTDWWLALNKAFHQLVGAAGIYELDRLCALAMSAEDTFLSFHVAKQRPPRTELGVLIERTSVLLREIESLQEHSCRSSG